MTAPVTGRLTVAWFPSAVSQGPAIGDPETTTWDEFASVFTFRRIGEKDGPCFCAARFFLEPDGRHVRRLGRNLLSRTAIALDCETSKATGEVPPGASVVAERIRSCGWSGLVYTSHSHRPDTPRFRVVMPLREEIACELPAPETVAGILGLAGVIDKGKLGGASLFYLPSAATEEDIHQTIIVHGRPLNTDRLTLASEKMAAQRQVEQDRIANEARREAAARRAAKIAAGCDPDDSLIEKLRAHLDLSDVLMAHGYDRRGNLYRHPNSTSGSYGASVKVLGGIERIYSHNAGDPLHASNLPEWCGGVTALDAIDATIILDYGGNRTKGLAELARRFGLNRADVRKALAKIIFRLIREDVDQEEIEAQAFVEAERLGLSRAEVIQVATWVANGGSSTREAA
jgi:hypothetical protein